MQFKVKFPFLKKNICNTKTRDVQLHQKTKQKKKNMTGIGNDLKIEQLAL